MTGDRPYRAAMPARGAREELLRHRGSQFGATVVDALVCALDLADNLPVRRHASLASVAQG